ncbi:MAG TPA: acyltransferase [Polyangiaceae bacterium]|nr:acyltransferase [Polyangiaceae bacterium]
MFQGKAGSPRRYYPALDALRSLAIAAVVWHHSTPRQLEGWPGQGHLGVQLFFCISGFLITRILLLDCSEYGRVRLVHFWARRALRIFPLYYVVLAAFTLAALLMSTRGEGVTDAVGRGFLANFPFFVSYTSNWFVDYGVAHPVMFGFSWSLATEEQFYLTWPVLVTLLGAHRAWLAGCALLLPFAISLLGSSAWAANMSPTGHRILASVSPCLYFGSSAALVKDWFEEQRNLRIRAPFTRARSRGLWALLATLLTLLVAGFVYSPRVSFRGFEALLAVWVLTLACAEDSSWLARLGTGKFGELGRLSYAVYLFHVPVIGFFRWAIPGIREEPLIVFPAALLATWLAARASQRWFEVPISRLRERWFPHAGQPRWRSRSLGSLERDSVTPFPHPPLSR